MEELSETGFAHLDYRCVALYNASCSVDFRLNYGDLALFLFISVMSVLTVCGNIVVIASIAIFKQLHTPTNFIICSLAVSDFLVGVFVMPMQGLMILDMCLQRMKSLCPVFHFISSIVGSVSLCNIVFAATDHYFALWNPFLYMAKVTSKTLRICISCGWISSVLYNVVLYIGNSKGERKLVCLLQCAVPANNTWGLIDIVFSFTLPCAAIISLYLLILRVALRHAKAISFTMQKTVSEKRKLFRNSQLKASKTLGIVVLVYVVCWIPGYMTLINLENLPDPTLRITIMLCLFYGHSCMNPFVYAISYPWFKKSLKLFFTLHKLA
ncbi:trace amine-associated receptor 13c-like [Pygocentrus nattereri]|uniref:trace amine-associated receptor 13c-like n=1 Tax=Pygocentrus nattereri TaxID=42514 RepID=UPI0008148AB2|nr:trace amine-associated receptor 13c-like [Pygocentrus nattereri]